MEQCIHNIWFLLYYNISYFQTLEIFGFFHSSRCEVSILDGTSVIVKHILNPSEDGEGASPESKAIKSVQPQVSDSRTPNWAFYNNVSDVSPTFRHCRIHALCVCLLRSTVKAKKCYPHSWRFQHNWKAWPIPLSYTWSHCILRYWNFPRHFYCQIFKDDSESCCGTNGLPRGKHVNATREILSHGV